MPPASWQETVLCAPHQEPVRGERVMGAQRSGEGGRKGGRKEGGLADPPLAPQSHPPPSRWRMLALAGAEPGSSRLWAQVATAKGTGPRDPQRPVGPRPPPTQASKPTWGAAPVGVAGASAAARSCPHQARTQRTWGPRTWDA